MSIRAEVALLAGGLELDESRRIHCPACGHYDMNVTRLAAGVGYNCFRASCGESGFTATAGELAQPEPKPQKLRPYHGALHPLTAEDRTYFEFRFGLSTATIGAHISLSEHGEYVISIRDPRGYDRGYVVRQPVWGGPPRPPRTGRPGYPKAKTWMHANGPVQSWYPVEECRRLVLVEDQISALCTMQAGVSAVALLGTHLNHERVREIAQQSPEEVVIALDADATDQAFALARRWGLAFPKVRVVLLSRDLKDEDQWAIPELVS